MNQASSIKPCHPHRFHGAAPALQGQQPPGIRQALQRVQPTLPSPSFLFCRGFPSIEVNSSTTRPVYRLTPLPLLAQTLRGIGTLVFYPGFQHHTHRPPGVQSLSLSAPASPCNHPAVRSSTSPIPATPRNPATGQFP